MTDYWGDPPSKEPRYQGGGPVAVDGIFEERPRGRIPESAEAEQPPPRVDPSSARAAAAEPWRGPQPTRHALYNEWQATATPEQARRAFEASMDAALDAEGVADPSSREHWKGAMRMMVIGDEAQGIKGEVPWLNPYAQAYDTPTAPSEGVDSSARGYYQFLTAPNGGAQNSVWQIVRPPDADDADVFDPVANTRGFIRAVRISPTYAGDPWRAVEEKRRNRGPWNPQLPDVTATPVRYQQGGDDVDVPLGAPFEWGGNIAPDGRGDDDMPLGHDDCSSFIANLIAHLTGDRVRLPALTDAMVEETEPIAPEEAGPGDLALHQYPGQGPIGYGHVGMLLGDDGMMLDQSTSDEGLLGRPGIDLRPVDHPFGQGGALTFRRVPGLREFLGPR
jgi:hypothetical protein